MTAASWILFSACALAALGLALFAYLRRETPGRGRLILAALRGAALVLIILLLFDPRMPAGADVGARGVPVLLDGSLSMTLPAAGGRTRWEAAVEQARSLARGGDVLVFGDAPRGVPADSLAGVVPDAPSSRLLPALEAAAEAGARRVVVVTDGGIEDAADIARWLPRLGIELDLRTIEAAGATLAVTEVEAPGWAQTGEPVEIRFGVSGTAGGEDSVRVLARHAGEVVGETVVAAPAAGRVATGVLRFTPATTGDAVRYEVALTGDDDAEDDDVRTVYLRISDEPAGVVLVSLVPDWEPRFLLPVLERALGLPVVGYLRAGPTDFIRTGTGGEAGERTATEDVRRAVAQADLLVLHGYDRSSPTWATEAVASAPRVLVLPGNGDPPLPFPVELDQAIADDWYVVDDVPGSPVAATLAGLDLAVVPPLTALHRATLGDGVWSALSASRGRRGVPAPLAVGGAAAGRRWVLATGSGYWRWAFRGGAPKQTYDRLWGGLAGWLVQEQGAIAAAGVRPVRRVVPRGARLAWAAPGLTPDSFAVRLQGEDGAVALDTVLVVAAGDTAAGPAMAPGQYRYEVRAFAGADVAGAGSGELTVERYSEEFARAAVPAGRLEADVVPVGPGAAAAPGRPLHASAWPFIVLILLIAAEWVLRRRWGLR